MLKTVANIFKIPDLRSKIIFTILMLVIFRVGSHIPVPGFRYQQLNLETGGGGPIGRAVEYMQMLTGGSFGMCTLFGMGIMPYITASIILMLLAEVMPALKKLRQEGQTGYKKINEYTRYLTVLVCVIQAMFYMKWFVSGGLIYSNMSSLAFILGIIGMTAGTIFLMWLGEQIDEYGIGNGISLIIMAGIIARLPWAISDLASIVKLRVGGSEAGAIGPGKLIILICSFVFIVAGVILITQAQRRIPIQQAKQVRGMRMYGGQRHYLPLRVNHGGVMPIIFASSFMMFVPVITGYLRNAFSGTSETGFFAGLSRLLEYDGYVYNVIYMLLIVLFSYFWVSVQFQPKDIAKNLQDSGSFIPGLRPGRRTSEYLESVMGRVTFYGGTFLALIAVVPDVVTNSLGIPSRITNFLGGTGLLIVVSVSLDLVQRIEANLLMRSYEGFSSTGRIKGAYA